MSNFISRYIRNITVILLRPIIEANLIMLNEILLIMKKQNVINKVQFYEILSFIKKIMSLQRNY